MLTKYSVTLPLVGDTVHYTLQSRRHCRNIEDECSKYDLTKVPRDNYALVEI
jgi:hypothetical protein